MRSFIFILAVWSAWHQVTIQAQTPNYQFSQSVNEDRIRRVSGSISDRLLLELQTTVDNARGHQGSILCVSVGPDPIAAVLKTCRLNGWFYQHIRLGACVERNGQQFCFPQAGNFYYQSDGQSWRPTAEVRNPTTELRSDSPPNYRFHVPIPAVSPVTQSGAWQCFT